MKEQAGGVTAVRLPKPRSRRGGRQPVVPETETGRRQRGHGARTQCRQARHGHGADTGEARNERQRRRCGGGEGPSGSLLPGRVQSFPKLAAGERREWKQPEGRLRP